MLPYVVSFIVNAVSAYVLTVWLQRRSACGCAHCESHRRAKAAGVNMAATDAPEVVKFRRVPASRLGDVRETGGGVH